MVVVAFDRTKFTPIVPALDRLVHKIRRIPRSGH